MQNCLIIDEESQAAFIEEVGLEAQQKGVPITLYQYDPHHNKSWLDYSSSKPTIKDHLLKEDLQTKLNKRIDVILCDYDFKLNNLDGFELLRWIRTRNKSTKLILYSGKGDLQRTFLNSKTPEEVVKIIRANISDVISREHRKGILFSYLKDSKFDTDLFILEQLSRYPDLKIQNSCPEFDGLTLGEILEYIADGSNKGFMFKKNLLELTIAHLLELEK